MSPRVGIHSLDDEPWRVPRLPEPRYSQSLERGLEVLACFTTERPRLGIVDIAEELGMSHSTTHRYAITLVALGYLEQDRSRKYRLALRVTDLGMSALSTTDLREHAHVYLEQLRTQSSYTVSLSVLDGVEIVYVDRAPSRRRGQDRLDMELRPGSRLPAYCTAMGKLLLAHLPKRELSKTLSEMRLDKRAPNTITNKGVLRRELEQIREDGFAVNDQDLAPGHRSIAVPVRAHSQEVVAALGMGAHSSAISLEDLIEHLMPHLVAAADRISARLGYRRDDERYTRAA
jgi:IclR family transcriptional regulator, pca regulon regulatory protein